MSAIANANELSVNEVMVTFHLNYKTVDFSGFHTLRLHKNSPNFANDEKPPKRFTMEKLAALNSILTLKSSIQRGK